MIALLPRLLAFLLPVALLVGCAWSAGDPEEPQGVGVPHPEGFVQGALHGERALALGMQACTSCHHEASTTAPTCESCHPSWPHPPGWLAGAVHGHGLAFRADEVSACQDCHATPGLVAREDHGCGSCHGSYPHPPGWSSPGAHGAYALTRGEPTAACGNCHGPDLGGGTVGLGCTACHEDFPHPPGWASPHQHGQAARDDLESCSSCHGPMGEGGNSGVSCSSCHPSYPHGDGWASAHLAVVDRIGEATCAGCHAPGDGPSPMPATCATACHGGAP